MIGDGYFQIRAKIGTSLYSLTSLARDLGAPESEVGSLHALQTRLREPLLFVAIGERGAGKSSLLNALFGRDFAGDPAFAGRAVTYRYGAVPREESRADGWLEIQRPAIFLRDFTLVEIPDGGAPETQTQPLSTADLVLAVLPATGDPKAACTLLASLDREVLQRCVCVIQQSDAVDLPELHRLVERLRQFMLSEHGSECPVFAVSALTRHGLHRLDQHIEREVVVSSARRESLHEICGTGREMLAALRAHLQTRQQAAETRRQQIEKERLALGDRRDQSLRHAADALWSLTRLFDSAQSRADRMLRRKLTLTGLWRDQPEWWREFHAELETRFRDSITRNFTTTFEKFEADLHGAWTQCRDALKRLRMAPCPPFLHDAPALFARLAADLAACDQDGATTDAMRRTCARARGKLRLPAFVALASVVVLGVAIFTSRHFAAAAGFTALAAAALLVVLGIVRRRALAANRGLMEGRRERVLSYFEQEVRAEIDRFYRALTVNFPSTDADAADAPTRERMRQLDELFARCAVEIAERRAVEV